MNDQNLKGVLIFEPETRSNVLFEVNDQYFADLDEYVSEKVVWLKTRFREVRINESTDVQNSKGYTVKKVEYTLLAGGKTWENRHYFILHHEKVYEIASSAESTAFGGVKSLSLLYDPFDSFRFQP